MRRFVKSLAICLMILAVLPGVSACGRHKKAAKPKVKTTAEVKNGTATASGKGSVSSEVPLRIGCGHFDNKFNPFMAETEADRQVVQLTQVMLLDSDRTGQVVLQGIDGELREYNGEQETYFGVADVKVRYKRKAGYTVYRITLRDDLLFSDGEPITIDDVIFTLYAFCDKDYTGPSHLKKSKIQGLEQYQKKKADTISGIRRLNDYELRIYTDGYDQDMLEKLRIPVCALHYYGDTTKYQYDAGRFGFQRGDLSALRANKTSPMGAGPYRFVKQENGIVYFAANELYYQECPETTYLYLEDLTRMVSADSANTASLAAEITGDTVDIVWTGADVAGLEAVRASNENEKIKGKTLEARFVTGSSYGYVCFNAKQLKVGAYENSPESIALRKALGTVISACRGAGQTPDETMRLVNAPVSVDSWLSPGQYGEGEIAFGQDLEGNAIYKSGDDNETKRKKAKEAALEYLEVAGYLLTEGQITTVPAGGTAEYTVWIQGGEDNPMYGMLSAAAEDLQELGITLRLMKVTDANTMQEQLQSDTRQIWCGVEQLGVDPELAVHYSQTAKEGGNKAVLTGIADAELEQKLSKLEQRVKPETRIRTTDAVYRILAEWAVEVPVYQTNDMWLMSSARIDMDTIPANMTPYYSVLREVHKIRMHKD